MTIDSIICTIDNFITDLSKMIEPEAIGIAISSILTALVPWAFELNVIAGALFILFAIFFYVKPAVKNYSNLVTADLVHIVATLFACIILHSFLSLIITIFVILTTVFCIKYGVTLE